MQKEIPPGWAVVAGKWTLLLKVFAFAGILPLLCELLHSPGAKLHGGGETIGNDYLCQHLQNKAWLGLEVAVSVKTDFWIY